MRGAIPKISYRHLLFWPLAILLLLLTQGTMPSAFSFGADTDTGVETAFNASRNHRTDDHITDCSPLVHKVKWRTKIQDARFALLPDALDFYSRPFFSTRNFHHTAQVFFVPLQFSFSRRGPPLGFLHSVA